MLQVFKVFFWSFSIACLAYMLRMMLKVKKIPSPELIIERIRENGY